MAKQQKKVKKPISNVAIYKIMLVVTFGVAALFLLKNLLGHNVLGAVTIGIVLAVLATGLIVMKIRKVDSAKKEAVLSVGLVFVVFFISLNSGESYSDDFPMFLAVVGMSGLYLRNQVTRIQVAAASIALWVMYFIHPEKGGAFSQYVLCIVIFVLAASLFSLTIKRGRAFIEISEEKAKEAERLLESMNIMGQELQNDFASSSGQIDESTKELREGSEGIAKGAREVSDGCENVQDRIHVAGRQIEELNAQVMSVETTLTENRANIEEMTTQIASVKRIMEEANEVFSVMEERTAEINKVAKQLSDISFNTTILSLNASIEAAHAGEAGVGFAVVAEEVRNLSDGSNQCSEQVTEVVNQLQEQVAMTAAQFWESALALQESEKTMNGLQESFAKLTEQFDILYGNIEAQNSNVGQIDTIFGELKNKVDEMSDYSDENNDAVEAIVEAMDIYKVNINRVIDDTKKLQIASET